MSDPIRKALAELVALKDLKDEESRLRQRRECSILRQPNKLGEANAMRDEYNRRKPLAWAAARAALAEQPSVREPLTDEQVAQLWSPHPGGEARRPIMGWAKVRDFADNIIAEYERINGIVSPSQTQSPWISVKDRMPAPDSGEVLVWLTSGLCAFDEWHIYSEDPTGMGGATLKMGLMWRDYEFDEVTHWMPLPVAPQQEGSS